jgi:cell wall-associated NlpC family hydrolase
MGTGGYGRGYDGYGRPGHGLTGYGRPGRGGGRSVVLSVAAAVVVLALAIGGVVYYRSASGSGGLPADAAAGPDADVSAAPTGAPAQPVDPAALRFARRTDPPRTVVTDGAGGPVAVFTDGARTVRLTGASRTFREPEFTKATITTDAWVRLAPQDWKAGAEKEAWFAPWLNGARADKAPDALAVALEYLHGAPERKDAKGVRYAGDAEFGPFSQTDPDGRAENSDFFDYLGVKWNFPDGGRSAPQPGRYGDLDCSGYLRMVYGYRLGYPVRSANTAGVGLPRRAFAMAQFGPGAVVLPDRKAPPTELDRLQEGDLVFFNLDPSDGPAMDHSGIYLGVDDGGHHRFLSSRSKANGPTFGDLGGVAILDGTGTFASKFRVARRL